MPQPTIAAIEGYAVGGGLVLALALDWRVLARGAFVSVPEIKIGLALGWGALPLLTALVGPARAKRAAILCERLTAERSAAWGLADEVADDGEAEAAALTMAAEAAAMPVGPARMAKATINAVAHALLPLIAHRDRRAREDLCRASSGHQSSKLVPAASPADEGFPQRARVTR